MTRDDLLAAAWSVLLPHMPAHHPDCPALSGGVCDCWAKVITARIDTVLDKTEPMIRDDERALLREQIKELDEKMIWHVGEYGDGFRTALFAFTAILNRPTDG